MAKIEGTWEDAVRWLLGQPDRAQLVRDCYYDDPLAQAAERYRGGDEWRAVQAYLHGRSGRALDVGAGRGIASYALACDGFEVTALEPDPSDLVGAGAIRRLARETGRAITVVETVSEQLPFEAGQFDVIFARAVLHHTRDLAAACREFARTLKPGGLVIAAREHVISRPEHLAAFLASHPLHELYGGEHAFRLDEYRTALAAAGLRPRCVLSPLESPINYYPQTQDSLIAGIGERLRGAPLGGALGRLLALRPLGRLALKLAGLVDHRPGRLFTFISEKPA
jgi:2-polyprenyl-3-methyl-5-hydroxy-6-metoxy-1,4-benzoquinol methylase